MLAREGSRRQPHRMSIVISTLGRYRATLLLAVSLLALGGVAGYGTLQLRHIVVLQARTDAVAAICTSLQGQQYDALATMIDPAPVPPLATGTFDRKGLLAKLQTLDQKQGKVTSCEIRALELGDESATYLLTLRRPHTPASIGMLVIVQHEPDGAWRISRRSPFTSNPV